MQINTELSEMFAVRNKKTHKNMVVCILFSGYICVMKKCGTQSLSLHQ